MKHMSILLLILSTVLASAAWGANNYTIHVGPPSGTDDTAVLQAALDNCMTNHPTGCTIQLSAGTYESQQLIAENFHGSIRGRGMHVTTIEVLAPLVITIPSENIQDQPPSRTNKYPVLLAFTGGDAVVSDMTFKVSAYDPILPWFYSNGSPGQTWLEAAVGVVGASANLAVERVACEGGPGQKDNFTNYNNCVLFWGTTGSTYTPLAGTFKFAASHIRHASNAFDVSEVRNAQFTFGGGSPVDGIVCEDCETGGIVLDTDNSIIEYSHNKVALAPYLPGGYFGVGLGFLVWQDMIFVPQRPSEYRIQHNTIQVTGDLATGILIVDYPQPAKAGVVIHDNTIRLGGSEASPAYAGIHSLYTVGEVISNNRIFGTNADFGISAYSDGYCMIKANDSQQLHPVLLYLTYDCTVISGNIANVIDEGSNDTLVGVNKTSNPRGSSNEQAMQRERNLLNLIKSRLH